MLAEQILFRGHSWHAFLRDEADQSVVAEIFKWREYRVCEEYISHITLPIIDVGAHAGFFTLYVRSLNQESKIIALEPEPENIKALRRHIAENNVRGVEVVPVALAEKSGKRWLEISTDSHNHQLIVKREKGEKKKVVVVEVLSLGALLDQTNIPKAGLIKMDIEGAETEVINSWTSEDFGRVGALILEYHNYTGRTDKALEETLRTNGFSVQLFPSKFDKRMGFLWAINKRFSK